MTHVVRTKNPAVRTRLIERAAQMLRAREPVTLRSVVRDTGLSTMAVYTYFGGMEGLWQAMRQEGFTRLATELGTVTRTEDPVRDLTALGAAYVSNGMANPDLYRVMFDATVDLENPAAADDSLDILVTTVDRAKEAGRFSTGVDARSLATQCWAIGHGLVSLVATGPLPREALALGAPMLVAMFVNSGDIPEACRDSVARGWHVRPADPA